MCSKHHILEGENISYKQAFALYCLMNIHLLQLLPRTLSPCYSWSDTGHIIYLLLSICSVYYVFPLGSMILFRKQQFVKWCSISIKEVILRWITTHQWNPKHFIGNHCNLYSTYNCNHNMNTFPITSNCDLHIWNRLWKWHISSIWDGQFAKSITISVMLGVGH